jgi:putative selenium metabolism protein SsnA
MGIRPGRAKNPFANAVWTWLKLPPCGQPQGFLSKDNHVLITNATIVNWEKPNRILNDHAIHVDDSGKISAIGPSVEITSRYSDPSPLDAQGQLVMPGNICAHTHFYGAFARGMTVHGTPPHDFPDILKQLWWPLDQALTEEDVQYSALVCLVDAIKHGTTTLFDHHASPNFIDGSLDVIGDAVNQSGLRAALCYEVTDRGGKSKTTAGIRENVRFIEKTKKIKNNLIAATFGLHAPLTLSDTTLDACLSANPPGHGFHTHLSESIWDAKKTRGEGNGAPVNWLHKHGILGPRSIAAHFVHSTKAEKKLIAETGTWVTHQPRSNMNNGVGVAPVEELLASGIKVCLGNDGFSNYMFEEWNAAYLLHKAQQMDPRAMSGNTIIEMGIYNNAHLANEFFSVELGVIKPGAAADLIFIDYKPYTELSPGNLPWHILFGFRAGMIRTTIVNGKILMKDGELTSLDEDRITNRAKELSIKVWKRYKDQF